MRQTVIDVESLKKAHRSGVDYALMLIDTYRAGLGKDHPVDAEAIRRAVAVIRSITSTSEWTPWG